MLKGIIYRRVDDKEPSKSNASFLNQDTIITRDCFVEIGEQWIVQATQTSFLI